jgi:hypothetical protein
MHYYFLVRRTAQDQFEIVGDYLVYAAMGDDDRWEAMTFFQEHGGQHHVYELSASGRRGRLVVASENAERASGHSAPRTIRLTARQRLRMLPAVIGASG